MEDPQAMFRHQKMLGDSTNTPVRKQFIASPDDESSIGSAVQLGFAGPFKPMNNLISTPSASSEVEYNTEGSKGLTPGLNLLSDGDEC